jgi:hypothetical protein
MDQASRQLAELSWHSSDLIQNDFCRKILGILLIEFWTRARAITPGDVGGVMTVMLPRW